MVCFHRTSSYMLFVNEAVYNISPWECRCYTDSNDFVPPHPECSSVPAWAELCSKEVLPSMYKSALCDHKAPAGR